ncbi:MAG TPA: SRPBCC domain-containing protein [Vicinamibacterales bacterium]|nr:SRPBCC domain-containing protein [Vicinamibacterales bacterium]
MTAVLTHSLDRSVVIRATRETVFRFFTDPVRWAAWWGAGSTIDARPGGAMRIRYPDGTEALGEVEEVSAPDRIVFTYGYAKGAPIPPGASRVTIHVEAHDLGSRVRLVHAFTDRAVLDSHVQGWRYQLSLFGNVVANEAHAGAAALADRWLAAWSMADETERRRTLDAIALPAVQFGDRYSVIDGRDELIAHIDGAIRFMGGVRLERRGEVRHCLGTLLVDWTAVRNGQPFANGTSVFVLEAGGRIASVTGFWH